MDLEFYLLPTWVNRQREDQPHAIQFFTSFFSYYSLKMLLTLCNEERMNQIHNFWDDKYHNTPALSYATNESVPVLQVILFPLNRSSKLNYQFLTKLEGICTNLPELEDPYQNLYQLVTTALNVLDGNLKGFQQKKKQIHSQIPRISQKELNYHKNRFLFGSVAAKYLESIRIFPYLRFFGQEYEGIPINRSQEEFLDRILLTATKSLSLSSQLISTKLHIS